MPYEKRRAHQRLNVQLPAYIRSKNSSATYPAEVLNISEGGALLRCEQPIASVGEEILVYVFFGKEELISGKVVQADKVEVHLEEDEAASCVIRWAQGNTGRFGVQFLKLAPEKLTFIRELVKTLAQNQQTEDET